MRLSAAILCLAATVTTSAFAQSPHEEAKKLFEQGRQLMAQEEVAKACAAFEGSLQLEPDPVTLLSLADCREKNAQLATAWRLFMEAERQTHATSDATLKRLNALAAARGGKLLPRLSRIMIDVAPDHRLYGLYVWRAGEFVDSDTWSQLQPIDGGVYKIDASAPGHNPWSSTVKVKPEGDIRIVFIPRLKPQNAGPRGKPRSAGAALGLSLGGTLVAYGCMFGGGYLFEASTPGALALYSVGGFGTLLAPSFGHWYAGNYFTTGLKLRLVALVATLGGTGVLVEGDTTDTAVAGVVLALTGVGMFVYGTIQDIGTASSRVRQHDRGHDLAISPIVSPSSAGFALGGRF